MGNLFFHIKDSRFRNGIYIFVLSILFIALFLFIYQRGYFNTRTSANAPKISVVLRINEIDEYTLNNDFDSKYQTDMPIVIVSLSRIIIPPGFSYNRLCIDEMQIINRVENIIKTVDESKDLIKGKCLDIEGGSAKTEEIFNISLPLGTVYFSNSYDLYNYPFDKRNIDFALRINAHLASISTPQKDVVIKTDDFDIYMVSSRWQHNLKVKNNDYEKSNTLVTLERPWVYRILIVILPFVFLLIIVRAFFLKEPGDFLQVVVGLLLGLWGVREVLVPKFIEAHTRVHDVILFLYFLIGLMTILKVMYLIAMKWGTKSSRSHHYIQSSRKRLSSGKRKRFSVGTGRSTRFRER